MIWAFYLKYLKCFGPFILGVCWAFSLKCIGPFLRKNQEKTLKMNGKVKRKTGDKEIRRIREFGDGVPVADSPVPC